MPGKYNFPGIKKAGVAGLTAALAATGWGLKLMASPFKPLVNIILGYLVEWLANNGLVVINLAAIYVDGKIDQSQFDKAFDEALTKVQIPGLTENEKELIDEKVRKAFRDFAHLNNTPVKPPDII